MLCPSFSRMSPYSERRLSHSLRCEVHLHDIDRGRSGPRTRLAYTHVWPHVIGHCDSCGCSVSSIVARNQIAPHCAQHQPSGNSGRPVVSGGVGSTYFSRQFFGGSFLAAANLASWSASHFWRRSVRMRARSFEAGSFVGCLARHSSVNLPSTAALRTAARYRFRFAFARFRAATPASRSVASSSAWQRSVIVPAVVEQETRSQPSGSPRDGRC